MRGGNLTIQSYIETRSHNFLCKNPLLKLQFILCHSTSSVIYLDSLEFIMEADDASDSSLFKPSSNPFTISAVQTTAINPKSAGFPHSSATRSSASHNSKAVNIVNQPKTAHRSKRQKFLAPSVIPSAPVARNTWNFATRRGLVTHNSPKPGPDSSTKTTVSRSLSNHSILDSCSELLS